MALKGGRIGARTSSVRDPWKYAPFPIPPSLADGMERISTQLDCHGQDSGLIQSNEKRAEYVRGWLDGRPADSLAGLASMLSVLIKSARNRKRDPTRDGCIKGAFIFRFLGKLRISCVLFVSAAAKPTDWLTVSSLCTHSDSQTFSVRSEHDTTVVLSSTRVLFYELSLRCAK